MKTNILAMIASTLLITTAAIAQTSPEPTTGELRAACEKSPGSAACSELQKRGEPAANAGSDASTLQPAAKGSGKAGGVTPQGNPATSGGGPRSGQ